ncbi:MAG: energy-coupling factor transporter transmembrane component T [Candidatus Aminicenantes bacterium]|jgi:energy-coupling factor transporter transmembrane protein EcfT|nr:energy-coupling factor transporter transmembrane component T [Candidatus Aminicenantes bacterium]
MNINLIASLDPRSKLIAFVTVQVMLFIPVSDQLPLIRLLSIAAPLLALLPVAGRSWRLWLRTLALAAPFLAFLAFSACFQPAMDWPALRSIILPIVGKTILVFLSLALFILNEEPWRLLQGLRQIGLPKAVVVILAIGYRFACQWGLELEGVRRAWTARNFSSLSKLRKIKYMGGALSLFFDRLLEGGVHIHDAMVSRGFHGSLPAWQRLVFAHRDAAFLALVAVTATAITIL